MPEHDISDITLEDVLGDLRAESIDVRGEVAGRSSVGAPLLPQTPDAALTRRLDGMASREVRTLHERRRPWTFLTLRHVVVCPAGVVVVDALDTPGRPSLRLEGGAGGPRRERLVAGGRDCSKRVESLLNSVRAVTRALSGTLPGKRAVDVHGVLASMADQGQVAGAAFTVQGVHVIDPDRLSARITGPGPLNRDEVELVTTTLTKAFPPA